MQHEAISKKSSNSKYTSLFQTFLTIYKEEGLFGLWKGHLSGQFLSVAFVTTQFFWFQNLTKLAYDIWPNTYDKDKRRLNATSHFLCGNY